MLGVVQAVLWLWLARSLYKGRRWAWRWAVGLLVVVIVIQILNLGYMVVVGERGLLAAGWELFGNALGLSVCLVGRHAFRNPSARRARRTSGSLVAPADDDQRSRATRLLREEGTVNRLAWMTTWPENRWFAPSSMQGYVAYRVHAGVALGLCDPVGSSEEERSELLGEFANAVHGQGLVPCLFTVTAETSRHARAQGWHSLQVAEEAWIELPTLDFVGKAWQDVRTAMNQAAKLGIRFRIGPLADMPRGIQMQVKAISSEWVEDKGLPEMGFTLGGVDEALDPQRPGRSRHRRRLDGARRHVVDAVPRRAEAVTRPAGPSMSCGGCPVASATPWSSSSPRPAWPSRRRAAPSSPSPVRPSPAPRRLPVTSPSTGARSTPSSTGSAPRWSPTTASVPCRPSSRSSSRGYEPLYLVFPDEAALPRIGLALSRAYLPDAGMRDLVALARSGRG